MAFIQKLLNLIYLEAVFYEKMEDKVFVGNLRIKKGDFTLEKKCVRPCQIFFECLIFYFQKVEQKIESV